MIKRFYILSIFVLIASISYGQFIGKDGVSKALFYLQKNELDSAKKYIDEAEKDENTNTLPKTWYYRALIYKDAYKTYEKEDKNSPLRNTAVEALNKLIEVDKENEFIESSQKMMTYLASTYYNDAARSLNPSTYKNAVDYYNKYKKLMTLAKSSSDLVQQDVKFNLALASMLNQNLEKETKKDSLKVLEVRNVYQSVLKIDPNNGSANYNVGILYYNEAADMINNMDYDMDLEELNRCQDICTDLFLKALPYMLKSYEQNWNKKETLIGLGNIYHGLNDSEKEEFYKNELKALEQDNK
jgi:hypothetical protein